MQHPPEHRTPLFNYGPYCCLIDQGQIIIIIIIIINVFIGEKKHFLFEMTMLYDNIIIIIIINGQYIC